MHNLEGRVAVVLGCSAERGTGWAIAEGLAKAGAKVVVAARTLSKIERLAKKIGGHAIVCDAGKADEVERLSQTAIDVYGRLDIAVNAAGQPVTGPISESTDETLRRAVDINYIANVHFVRDMAKRMNDGGSIVLITSSSAQQVVPMYFSYACAKAATDCLVRYAALEYGARGIRVNSILPGAIKSELAAHLFDVPEIEAVFASHVPLNRIGLPTDYADAVLWLSGPAFVTGLNLPVSGGAQLTLIPRQDEIPALNPQKVPTA